MVWKPYSTMTEEEKKKQAEAKKRYRARNKEKISEYSREYGKKSRENNPVGIKLNDLKWRCNNKGIPFDLTKEDLDTPSTCPVLGIKLEKGSGKHQPNSPSVDRIIPELGYVKGNTQIISYKANVMKHDATPEELRMFAKWVLRTFPEEPDVQT